MLLNEAVTITIDRRLWLFDLEVVIASTVIQSAVD